MTPTSIINRYTAHAERQTMTHDEFTTILDMGGIKYERTDAGIEIKGRGSVYLSSLTTLSEGVTFSNGGDVYLDSLTTLPEGVTFSNSGYVDLRSLRTDHPSSFAPHAGAGS